MLQKRMSAPDYEDNDFEDAFDDDLDEFDDIED